MLYCRLSRSRDQTLEWEGRTASWGGRGGVGDTLCSGKNRIHHCSEQLGKITSRRPSLPQLCLPYEVCFRLSGEHPSPRLPGPRAPPRAPATETQGHRPSTPLWPWGSSTHGHRPPFSLPAVIGCCPAHEETTKLKYFPSGSFHVLRHVLTSVLADAPAALLFSRNF